MRSTPHCECFGFVVDGKQFGGLEQPDLLKISVQSLAMVGSMELLIYHVH